VERPQTGQAPRAGPGPSGSALDDPGRPIKRLAATWASAASKSSIAGSPDDRPGAAGAGAGTPSGNGEELGLCAAAGMGST